MGNLLCSGLWTPAFLLFMFIFVSSLKHYSTYVIYIVLYICFYIHYIITQVTCDFRWGNLDLQMFGHLLKVTQLGSDIQSWQDSALRFLTQAHGSPTTLLSLLKKEWNSNQSFSTIRKAAKSVWWGGSWNERLKWGFSIPFVVSLAHDRKLFWISLLLLDSSTSSSSSGYLDLMLLNPGLDSFFLFNLLS